MFIIEETYPSWIHSGLNRVGIPFYDMDVYDYHFSEKVFRCPLCNALHTFYHTSAMGGFCTACHKGMIDIDKMMNSKAYLLKYHFNIINDEGEENQ